MTLSTVAPVLPTVSPEVAAFAFEHGASPYVTAVLGMTQRIFQRAPLAMSVEEDPEIANDRHIVFEIDVTGMDEEQLFAAQTEWSREIFRQCPATLAAIFRYGLVAAA
jgi:hypothetical protein